MAQAQGPTLHRKGWGVFHPLSELLKYLGFPKMTALQAAEDQGQRRAGLRLFLGQKAEEGDFWSPA